MMLNGLILNKETLGYFKEDTDIAIIKCLSAYWIDFPSIANSITLLIS